MQNSKHWLQGCISYLSEDLSRVKKIQPETKDTLIEIKKNLQENNSRVDEAEIQINDLQHKEEKNPTNQNNKKKKEFEKIRTV